MTRLTFTQRLAERQAQIQARPQHQPPVTPSPTSDTNAGFLDVSKEGICPKTGLQMTKARLVGGSKPQEVWWCEKSRVAMPVTNAKGL